MIQPISGIRNTAYISPIQSRPYSVRAAMPEAPVTPVRPAPVVRLNPAQSTVPSARSDLSSPMWTSSYPIEQANRARVQYSLQGASLGKSPSAAESSRAFQTLDWPSFPGMDARELAARMRVQYPGEEGAEAFEYLPGYKELPGSQDLPGAEAGGEKAMLGADGAQQAAEEGRCQTCEERKYQDGSDDSSVSFQPPTHIDPDAAQAAVRGHELEHVSHEQAKAKREGRKVVSQTVTMHTDICPECGRVYVSGGTTRTVTKAENSQPAGSETSSEEDF